MQSSNNSLTSVIYAQKNLIKNSEKHRIKAMSITMRKANNRHGFFAYMK